ncbi:MAG TPA: substrate-binding domain-containing protein [Pseudonocardiaceae bacterium]|nr:substrate-binding domain-containing protein [Pseudonocardiaceae bacterium]
MAHHRRRFHIRFRLVTLVIGAVCGVSIAATATAIEIQTACSGQLDLAVTVAPALAPEVDTAANAFNATKPAANGKCVEVMVTTDESANEAEQLPTQQVGPPALWIPDSSLWAREADAAIAGNRQAARLNMLASLATSPLVLAAPLSLAHRIGWPSRPPNWSTVAAGELPTIIGNPSTTTEGLAGILMLESVLGTQASAPSPALVALLVKLGHSSVSDLAGQFGADSPGAHAFAFTATEQAVIQANQQAGAAAFAAMVPKEGTFAFDYPLVRVVSQSEVEGTASAAAEFAAALESTSTTAMLTAAGFRAAHSPIPGARAYPSGPVVATVVRTWLAVNLDARFLTVVDVSSSMNMPLGPGGGDESKADIVRDATTIGLSEFPDTTEIGLWAFSDQLAPPNDWLEVVPTGLLGEPMNGVTRRIELQRASAALPSMVHGTTALYSTALAAYQDAVAGYDPAKVNAVVLMTDGFNDTNHGPDLATTVATLRSMADPQRPLPLFTIGIGPAADMDALSQLAAATGGRAFRVSTATDIVNVFLDVLALRA